jgi:RHS repeat-associated protein
LTELGITAAERNIVWTYNPFRYRGYYYDTDIGLYYLQSRYYNPQWGRFLNADGYVNANGDMIGFNMYAYCNNNPVMLVDSSGNRAERIVRVNGGVVDQDPRTLRYFLYCLKQDMQAFDIDNESEDAVFAANYLAGYNGTVVVKTSLLGHSAFSFGIIVMGDKITQPDTIKHEFGHYLQFKDMGLVNYSRYVAAPSLLHAGLRKLGIVQNYHSLPWEYDANMRSGAKKGLYTVDAEARRQEWKLWMEACLWM